MSMRVAAVDLDRINYVNIGLMLASLVVACLLPFEAFLAAYAVLGPLHYLTQISWLHDRGYFVTGRWDWVPLAALGVLALDGAYFDRLGWPLTPFVAGALGVAAAFARSTMVKVAAFACAALFAWPLADWPPARLLFGALLPTVIHVYVFTALFVLAGARKARSRSGYLSLAVHVACGIGLLVAQPATAYQPSAWAHESMGPFWSLVDEMGTLVPGNAERPALVAIGRFLAFAYTYHYLNWFSKTEVIRWHLISRTRLAVIVTLWLASVGLYAYDYAAGLAALFFLSIVHVFLEFPLDARTIGDLLRAPAGAR